MIKVAEWEEVAAKVVIETSSTTKIRPVRVMNGELIPATSSGDHTTPKVKRRKHIKS